MGAKLGYVLVATAGLVGGLPLAADAASQGPTTTALPQTITGDAAIGVGVTNTRFNDGDWSSFNKLNGSGRVNIRLDDRWNFEFEANGEAQWDSTFSGSVVGSYGHLWGRAASAALGVFGGVRSTTTSGGPGSGMESLVSGIEGEIYFGNLTLGGQASATWNTISTVGYSKDFDAWQLRGYVHYYLTPNDKVSGDVRYSDPFAPGPGITIPDQTGWVFAAAAEHRFANMPWSIWASGSYATLSSSAVPPLFPSVKADRWTALVGFRMLMDAPGSTLQGHDRDIPFDYQGPTDVIVGVVSIR